MTLSPREAVVRALARHPAPAIGVAVSGGGDSMALMLLLAEALAGGPVRLMAASVDHGLRPAATAEAMLVAARAAQAGIAHEVLPWRGWTGQGNLQAEARGARRALLARWAQRHGLRQVWLAHTADDQAETFLMNLARGSGVDGLSSMPERHEALGVTWMRPLLTSSRADLRSWLAGRGESWVEDPSNDDAGFDRIRLRRSMPVLAGLGLTRERLLLAANAMARVRPVLEDATAALARAAARITPAAECVITRSDYLSAPQEIRLRLMARALTWVGGRDAPPRLDSLIAADADIGRGLAAFTLHGCQVRVRGASLVIRREAARTAPPVPPDAEWDGRWLVRGAGRSGGLVLGALGAAGLSQLPDWRASGHPREALLSTPALWQGTTLISAPLAGRSAGYTACFARDLPWDRNAG